MKKIEKGLVSVRYNVSEKAVQSVRRYQALETLKGNKITKEQAADYILSNFKSK